MTHPLFVYGTLMSDQPRHDLLDVAVTRLCPARVTGATLLDLGSYPMLVAGTGTVRGELCWLAAGLYDEILTRLDRYEGELYRRALWTVQPRAGGAPVTAWLYEGEASEARRHPVIASGDWRLHGQRTRR